MTRHPPQPDSLHCGDNVKIMRAWTSDCVDLTVGSPPYCDCPRYPGVDVPRDPQAWADWMIPQLHYLVRSTRGPVLIVANNPVRKRRYLPACELLVATAFQNGFVCERPLIWHKNAPPSRRDWFGNDWEFVLAFKSAAAPVPHFDWKSIGTPPKYKNGGLFRQRGKNGHRRNGGVYPTNPVTRPRDVIRALVGGGHMGSKVAHKGEAPYPETLVEPLIKALCPPGGIVLDPWIGTGTTAAVARRLGRRFVGIDIRQSQIDMAAARVAAVEPEAA